MAVEAETGESQGDIAIIGVCVLEEICTGAGILVASL